MKLVAAIKLSREQAAVLKATLKRCNDACTALAARGFAASVLRQFDPVGGAFARVRGRRMIQRIGADRTQRLDQL
jgi:hypothetical protein